MRWKARFFLNNNEKNKKEVKRKTFGFKSKHHLGQLKELKFFEKDLLDLVTSLKFRKLIKNFHEKMISWTSNHHRMCLYLQIKPVIFIKQLCKNIISY